MPDWRSTVCRGGKLEGRAICRVTRAQEEGGEVRLERLGGPIMEGFESQSGVKLDTT